MRTPLSLATLLILMLSSWWTTEAALMGLLRGSGYGSGRDQGDAITQSEEESGSGDDSNDDVSSAASVSQDTHNLRTEATQQPATPVKELKKYRAPGQQTRRERRCAPSEQEECGQGLGYLLCEYNEEQQTYATRCVRQHKTSLHLQLSPHNYCGTCRRCFEDTEELRHAVAAYISNSTAQTEVAHNYGWPINRWCVSRITDFSDLFAHQRKFRDSIADWDVSQAVNMSGMFQSAFAFNSDLSLWNTARVKDMSRMFDCAYEFNQPLATWNTQKVTTTSRMFRVAKKFDQDLSQWTTKRLTDLSHMFYRAHSFQQSLQGWDTSRVTDTSFLFAFTRKFNDSSIVPWDVSNVETMRGMFQNTGAFDQDLSSWNVQSVSDTSFMFYRALAFQEDDDKQRAIVTNWDLSRIQDKQNMFAFALNISQTEDVVMSLSHPSYDGSNKMTPAAAHAMTTTNVGLEDDDGAALRGGSDDEISTTSESGRGGFTLAS